MKIFDRFKKTPKTPLTKVSLKYAETKEEIHVELCRLAWQWTIGNATYDDAVDVIQEGKPFIIPKDDYAQLDVRDYRVYDGEKGRSYYWPDDEEGTPAVVLRKGKFLGCICEGKNSVEDLADRDDAHIFIERLEQLHKMYAEVESGKKLPKEEPKKEEESSDKKEKPETKAEEKQQESAEDKKQETSVMAYRPMYDLLGELPTNDAVAMKLQGMNHDAREDTFNKLRAEYNAVMAEMQQYAEKYLSGMAFYATAIKSFNSDQSSAAKFLRELEDERKKKEKPQEEKPDDKSGGKKEDPNKDTKQKNFINRQKKKVNSWIRQAEAADDDFLLDVLDDMKIALDKSDVDEYKKLKKRYDRLAASADQQTNHDDDSSTNSTGSDDQDGTQTAEESESEEEDSEDNTSEEETTEETEADDGTSSDGASQEDSDKKYPIKDVVAWMRMVGVTDIPVILTMSSDQTKGISATWVNSHMESIGNDNRLAQ